MSLSDKRHVKEAEISTTKDLGDEYDVYPTELPIHTPEYPFCDDMTCPCHEDKPNVSELSGYYHDGLVSQADADRIYRGKTL